MLRCACLNAITGNQPCPAHPWRRHAAVNVNSLVERAVLGLLRICQRLLPYKEDTAETLLRRWVLPAMRARCRHRQAVVIQVPVCWGVVRVASPCLPWRHLPATSPSSLLVPRSLKLIIGLSPNVAWELAERIALEVGPARPLAGGLPCISQLGAQCQGQLPQRLPWAAG